MRGASPGGGSEVADCRLDMSGGAGSLAQGRVVTSTTQPTIGRARGSAHFELPYVAIAIQRRTP